MSLEIKLKPGDTAPDFLLKDQDSFEVSLSSFHGKKVLLSFHPLAWMGVCEIQMRRLEVKFEAFEELNTLTFGISTDTVPCNKQWADHLEIKHTRLLSDFWPHGEAIKKYGLFIEKHGVSERANILIDEQGKIQFVRVYAIAEIPNIEDILRALRP